MTILSLYCQKSVLNNHCLSNLVVSIMLQSTRNQAFWMTAVVVLISMIFLPFSPGLPLFPGDPGCPLAPCEPDRPSEPTIS